MVCHPLDDPAPATIEIAKTFADVLAMLADARIIAVDIPIGLPDVVGIGGRPADIAARAVLGARQSAVFAVPARAAVACIDYRDACEAALRHSDPPRKVSKQTFNLFPKIREVDALITAKLQQRVREVHPEAAFWALNGERPLDLPKKVKSQPHQPGLEQRKKLLVAAGYDGTLLADHRWPRRIAGPDDILDACANAWSAMRIVNGTARRFPEAPATDTRGLRMEIWC